LATKGRQFSVSGLPPLSELHAREQQARFDFLSATLALCHTFADLVRIEFGLRDREGARLAFRKAYEGFATITRLLPRVDNAVLRNEMENGLNALRTKLSHLQVDFPLLKI
jgi:hypothetical protein